MATGDLNLFNPSEVVEAPTVEEATKKSRFFVGQAALVTRLVVSSAGSKSWTIIPVFEEVKHITNEELAKEYAEEAKKASSP